ncbi:MAG: hypothetical protein IPL65_12890 [Lewinellaceae bacterium]|nr:hypothetical protein [Lewinellaceae bacterium]
MYTVPGTLGRGWNRLVAVASANGRTGEGGLTQRMVSMGWGCCPCCGQVLDGFREGVLAMLFERMATGRQETTMH